MPQDDLDLLREYLKTKSSTVCFTLVSRHQQAVFGMCYKILKNREEAEEAAQDSFVKFFDSLNKLRDPEKFKSWLLSIAYRTAIDTYRRRSPHAVDIEEVSDRMTPEVEDPHHAMHNAQKRQLLKNIFNEMNSLDASILNLYYMEDLPVKQIAEVLNQTESNVKIRLMRTRGHLKQRLEPLYKTEFKP